MRTAQYVGEKYSRSLAAKLDGLGSPKTNWIVLSKISVSQASFNRTSCASTASIPSAYLSIPGWSRASWSLSGNRPRGSRILFEIPVWLCLVKFIVTVAGRQMSDERSCFRMVLYEKVEQLKLGWIVRGIESSSSSPHRYPPRFLLSSRGITGVVGLIVAKALPTLSTRHQSTTLGQEAQSHVPRRIDPSGCTDNCRTAFRRLVMSPSHRKKLGSVESGS